MKNISNFLKTFLFVFLLGIISVIANAQNLPKVQKTSLRAPDNIKIDGKPTEWNNHFQAYNTSTDLFYTIANDDKNLYLVIQVKDLRTIRKIGAKGITFTIQKSGKKEYKDGMAVTYPTTKLFFTNISMSDDAETVDSTMLRNNNLLQNKVKYIGVKGVKDIDTTISVYNEYGIKAVGLFDNKKVYTYELAVPLKVLGLSLSDPIKFAYNIRLNGMTYPNPPSDDPQHAREALARASAVLGAPTDFWGEYTLAKK